MCAYTGNHHCKFWHHPPAEQLCNGQTGRDKNNISMEMSQFKKYF